MKEIGRYVVIGDVHGCLAELKQLLQKCELRPNDCLVYVGDLLDKGPQGPQTVLWVQEQAQKYKTILIMGNHELKNLKCFQSFTKRLAKNPANPLPNNEYSANYFGLGASGIKFLEQSLLYFRIPNTQFVVVHAGVTPKCILPASSTITDIAKINQSLLRVRFVRIHDEVELTTSTTTVLLGDSAKITKTKSHTKKLKKNVMITLGEEWEHHQYWAQGYEGRLGHILFGHSAWKEESSAKEFPHATGIDLGCVYGGKLCAAIVTPSAAEQNAHISYVTVDAQKTYSHHYKPTLFDENGYFREE